MPNAQTNADEQLKFNSFLAWTFAKISYNKATYTNHETTAHIELYNEALAMLA